LHAAAVSWHGSQQQQQLLLLLLLLLLLCTAGGAHTLLEPWLGLVLVASLFSAVLCVGVV